MATIKKHTWTRTELDERGRPRRVTLAAYGYDLRVNGRRERRWDAAWRTPADARLGLAIAAIHAENRQRYGSPRIHAKGVHSPILLPGVSAFGRIHDVRRCPIGA